MKQLKRFETTVKLGGGNWETRGRVTPQHHRSAMAHEEPPNMTTTIDLHRH